MDSIINWIQKRVYTWIFWASPLGNWVIGGPLAIWNLSIHSLNITISIEFYAWPKQHITAYLIFTINDLKLKSFFFGKVSVYSKKREVQRTKNGQMISNSCDSLEKGNQRRATAKRIWKRPTKKPTKAGPAKHRMRHTQEPWAPNYTRSATTSWESLLTKTNRTKKEHTATQTTKS